MIIREQSQRNRAKGGGPAGSHGPHFSKVGSNHFGPLVLLHKMHQNASLRPNPKNPHHTRFSVLLSFSGQPSTRHPVWNSLSGRHCSRKCNECKLRGYRITM